MRLGRCGHAAAGLNPKPMDAAVKTIPPMPDRMAKLGIYHNHHWIDAWTRRNDPLHGFSAPMRQLVLAARELARPTMRREIHAKPNERKHGTHDQDLSGQCGMTG